MIKLKNYITKPEKVRAFVFHAIDIHELLNSDLFVDIIWPDESWSYMINYEEKGTDYIQTLYNVEEWDIIYQCLDDDGTRWDWESTFPNDFYDMYMWDAVNN